MDINVWNCESNYQWVKKELVVFAVIGRLLVFLVLIARLLMFWEHAPNLAY